MRKKGLTTEVSLLLKDVLRAFQVLCKQKKLI